MNRSGVVIALVVAGLSAAYGLSEEQLQQLGLGAGPPEVQDHCADSSNYCREWALRGECDRNPRYMLQGCRKSCKRCIPKHEDLFLQDSRQIRLHTSYGTIAINIYRTAAPKTTYKLLHIAQRGARGCTRCKIYRAEGNETYASGHHGQGLLQGTFASLNDAPSLEGNLAVRRGHVALLPNTREFIIALRDHPEFGLAHTVFGEIDAQSQAVVDAIAGQPGKEFSHPVYGNPMRILQDDVPFTVDAFKPGAPSAADIRKAENLARHRATHINMTLPEMSAKGMLDDLVETGLNITRLLESEQAASSPAPPAADRMEQVGSSTQIASSPQQLSPSDDEVNEHSIGGELAMGAASSSGAQKGAGDTQEEEDPEAGEVPRKDYLPLNAKHDIAHVYTPREDVIPMDKA